MTIYVEFINATPRVFGRDNQYRVTAYHGYGKVTRYKVLATTAYGAAEKIGGNITTGTLIGNGMLRFDVLPTADDIARAEAQAQGRLDHA